MDFFEKYADRYDIDLTGTTTREEKIEIFAKERKYVFSFIFENLTKEEKIKYLEYAHAKDIEEFLLTLPNEERISIIKSKLECMEEGILEYIGTRLSTDKEKFEYLEIINNYVGNYYKSEIICKMVDDNYKLLALDNFVNDEYSKIKVVKEMPDEFKELYIDKLSKISYKVEVILSLNNKELIKKYSELPIYSNYRSKLVSATNDSEYIIKKFNEINVLKFRLNLINLITDENLKVSLIDKLENVGLKNFLLSNINQTSCVKLEENELLETKIDPNITIGVELECSNKEIDKFNGVHTLYNEYTIKSDSSVKSGFEIVSPVLHYTLLDMTKLKSVCNLLKENNFYTDKSCGGHIHIGASYFTRKEDFYMLLYLYANTENILYYICDRKNTLKRPSVNRYAMKTKSDYIKAIDNGLFNTEHYEEEMNVILNEINKDRYKGLNFKNLGTYYKNTIEFRMPNGEIDFNELLLNIKLFARLIEVSHELVSHPNEDFYKLASVKSEKEKLNILLDLLFTSEEEKNLYKDRYYTNKLLEKKTERKFLEDLKSKIIKQEEVAVEYDKETHTLKKKVL